MKILGSVQENNMAEGQEWSWKPTDFRGQRWETGREQKPERKWNEEERIEQKLWSDSFQFLTVAEVLFW